MQIMVAILGRWESQMTDTYNAITMRLVATKSGSNEDIRLRLVAEYFHENSFNTHEDKHSKLGPTHFMGGDDEINTA